MLAILKISHVGALAVSLSAYSCGGENMLSGTLADIGGGVGSNQGKDLHAEDPAESDMDTDSGGDLDEDVTVEVPVVISGGHLLCDFAGSDTEATCYLSVPDQELPVITKGDRISIEGRYFTVLAVGKGAGPTELILSAVGEAREHLKRVTGRNKDELLQPEVGGAASLPQESRDEALSRIPEAVEQVQDAGVVTETVETPVVSELEQRKQQAGTEQPVTCREGVTSYIVSPEGMVHSEAVAWCAVQGGSLYDHANDSLVYSDMKLNMLNGSFWIASYNGNDYQSSCLAMTFDSSGDTVNTLLSCDADQLPALCECQSGDD